MKIIPIVLLLFSTFHARTYIPDALFATVVHVAADDTLSVRKRPDYHSRKLGAFPNGAGVYLDRCVNKGRSRWCRIHPDSLVDFGGVAGWVNARFLSFSDTGYVRIKGRKNGCFVSLKCRGGRCLVVTRILGDEQIAGLKTEWIPRDRLIPSSKFGAQSEGEEGYCTSRQYIDAFLKHHPLSQKRPLHKATTRTAADHILHLLQKHAWSRLVPYIHPDKGVILTEMVSFADPHRLHFTRSALSQALTGGKVFYWGDTYGRGAPIRMDRAVYLKRLIRRSAPGRVMDFLPSTKHFPLTGSQPRQGIEYYWTKPRSKTKEYDWQGLVLILERYHGRWYLIGMMRDRWTI